MNNKIDFVILYMAQCHRDGGAQDANRSEDICQLPPQRRSNKFLIMFSLLLSLSLSRFSFRVLSDSICRLLYSVLPVTVANELRHQRPVAPKR